MLMHELAKAMQKDRERAIASGLRGRGHLATDDRVPGAASGAVAATDRTPVRPSPPAPARPAAAALPAHVDLTRG